MPYGCSRRGGCSCRASRVPVLEPLRIARLFFVLALETEICYKGMMRSETCLGRAGRARWGRVTPVTRHVLRSDEDARLEPATRFAEGSRTPSHENSPHVSGFSASSGAAVGRPARDFPLFEQFPQRLFEHRHPRGVPSGEIFIPCCHCCHCCHAFSGGRRLRRATYSHSTDRFPAFPHPTPGRPIDRQWRLA